MDPETPVSEDKIRFVCISDTHAAIEKQPIDFVPVGDVLIHAGDITNVGQPHEIKRFNEYLGKNCMQDSCCLVSIWVGFNDNWSIWI
jgi:3',5'-cyclic AMP phosphodiesterase CpdA